MDVGRAIHSRPSSGLAHPVPQPSSVIVSPASEPTQTATPHPNVKEWADYQSSVLPSNENNYTASNVYTHEHLQPPYVIHPRMGQQDEGQLASYTAAGLGIEQPSEAYTCYPLQHEATEAQVAQGQAYSVSASTDACSARSTIFGFSPSSNEVGPSLTWSPDSEHTDVKEHRLFTTPPIPILQCNEQANTLIYSSSTQHVALASADEMQDNEATLKRHSFNPTYGTASYFSSDSSAGIRSASNSPAPPPHHPSGTTTSPWRRAPLPFSAQANPEHIYSTTATVQQGQPSLLSQSLPSSSVAGERTSTPQVTLSPAVAFHEDGTASRPWSPQDYLGYNRDTSQPPMRSASVNSVGSTGLNLQLHAQQRSVSPQPALLAPLPIYASQLYMTVHSPSPDQLQLDTHLSRPRLYSNNSSTSATSLSAFRAQNMPYRDSYSPISSSVGSYHSESTDEGDAASQGDLSSTGANIRSPSSLSFSGESPYDSQFFFEGMQIATSPDYVPDRSASALSNISNGAGAVSHLQMPSLQTSAMHIPGAQQQHHLHHHRSSSSNVIRRIITPARDFAHPYHPTTYHRHLPMPGLYRRDSSTHPSVPHFVNEASRSAPDLSHPAFFDTSMYLRTPSPLEQTGNWVIPTEEDLKRAAVQYSYHNETETAAHGAGRHAHSDPEVDGSGTVRKSEAFQSTLMPRRNTRSAPKPTSAAQIFDNQTTFERDSSEGAGGGVDYASNSTSNEHPLVPGQSGIPVPIDLPALGTGPASVRRVQSGINGSGIQMGQALLPLYMLPTKKSRGRRPVVSPDLDIDPNIDSTTASTMNQVSFTGVTKTGKPKKIFVCRVPGCDKCFRRSEHLKRHIRSIHTHDKREWTISGSSIGTLSLLSD